MCGTWGFASDTLLAVQAEAELENHWYKSVVGVRRFTVAHGY